MVSLPLPPEMWSEPLPPTIVAPSEWRAGLVAAAGLSGETVMVSSPPLPHAVLLPRPTLLTSLPPLPEAVSVALDGSAGGTFQSGMLAPDQVWFAGGTRGASPATK